MPKDDFIVVALLVSELETPVGYHEAVSKNANSLPWRCVI